MGLSPGGKPTRSGPVVPPKNYCGIFFLVRQCGWQCCWQHRNVSVPRHGGVALPRGGPAHARSALRLKLTHSRAAELLAGSRFFAYNGFLQSRCRKEETGLKL